MNLSLRVKIPLALCVISLLTAAILLSVFAISARHSLREHLIGLAEDVGNALAPALAPALRRDDLWQAYTLLADIQSTFEPLLVIVDNQSRVYVANRPAVFPTLQPLDRLPGGHSDAVAAWLAGEHWRHPLVPEGGELAYVAAPIQDGQTPVLGRLVVGYPQRWIEERFGELILRAVLSTLAVTLVIIAIGMAYARRVVRPLRALSLTLDRLDDDDAQIGGLPRGGDEIGRLGERLRELVADRRTKRALEREIVSSERLAALGRLSAGIAHEINNPLGGMLNALDTYRRHGDTVDLTQRTFSFIERGLKQIRDIVSALLVDVRRGDTDLAPQDLADVDTLIRADGHQPRVSLRWRGGLEAAVPVPATRVRQVLMNLLLNAVSAAAPDGEVTVTVQTTVTTLELTVDNTGTPMPDAVYNHLFEPRLGGEGGLGLWITYQIVTQLGGRIGVQRQDWGTRVVVSLPFKETPP